MSYVFKMLNYSVFFAFCCYFVGFCIDNTFIVVQNSKTTEGHEETSKASSHAAPSLPHLLSQGAATIPARDTEQESSSKSLAPALNSSLT